MITQKYRCVKCGLEIVVAKDKDHSLPIVECQDCNTMTMKVIDEATKEEIIGAVARGWCSEKNANKTMDSDLAMAISEEVFKLPCVVLGD